MPGLVRSEFHTRQGMDMSEVPRMEAATLVQGSLADLERGVVVSIPRAAKSAAGARRRRGGAGPVHARGGAARAYTSSRGSTSPNG